MVPCPFSVELYTLSVDQAGSPGLLPKSPRCDRPRAVAGITGLKLRVTQRGVIIQPNWSPLCPASRADRWSAITSRLAPDRGSSILAKQLRKQVLAPQVHVCSLESPAVPHTGSSELGRGVRAFLLPGDLKGGAVFDDYLLPLRDGGTSSPRLTEEQSNRAHSPVLLCQPAGTAQVAK